MNSLYRVIGTSKQAFHKKHNRMLAQKGEEEQILFLVYQLREDHPTMGLRDMHYKLSPSGMGRDRFEQMCKERGLSSKRPKNYIKTTDSSGVIRFDNLLIQIEIECPNQVWQSDITYFEVRGKFYYLTFIQDSFSRVIVGHYASSRLLTEATTIPALKRAIRNRKEKDNLKGLIFHSDGGGQYYAKGFLELTKKEHFRNSMCDYSWENGKVERLHGVIKNNYLKHRQITNFDQLRKEVDRAVQLYNNEKPHIKLKRKTPVMFENDYLYSRQQTDGDKSATDDNLQANGKNSPAACRQQTSGSNIAQDKLINDSKQLVKTVNLI